MSDQQEDAPGASNTESASQNTSDHMSDNNTQKTERKPTWGANPEPMSDGCRALIALLKSKVPEDQQLVFCAQHESINDANRNTQPVPTTPSIGPWVSGKATSV